MKKRTFLKNTSAVGTGVLLSPLVSCKTAQPLTNWAGNQTYSTSNVHYPKNLDELRKAIVQSKFIKGLGSRHSFNKIADSQYNQVSLQKMNSILKIDKKNLTVEVEAGVRYGDICEELHNNGLAFHNLASLPHISIVGACATSTHGSGVKNGGLATAIGGFEIIKADGEIVNISANKDRDIFYGLVVGLGGLGIISKITLNVQPTYQMEQVVYRNMPMSSLESNFNEIMASGYSVSLFTDWKNKNINEVWIKSLTSRNQKVSGQDYFGGTLAKVNVHPVEELSAESCTEQLGIVGAWYERLPHFKMGFTPSSGDELQAEYFVPFENGYKAMMAIEKMNKKISPHLFISEIRTIDSDNLWMSPFYKRSCVAIHFTFKPEWQAVQKLLPMIEEALSPFNVRPHWAKLFAMAPPVLQSRIEKLADFKLLLKEFDPEEKFKNDFIRRNLY